MMTTTTTTTMSGFRRWVLELANGNEEDFDFFDGTANKLNTVQPRLHSTTYGMESRHDDGDHDGF